MANPKTIGGAAALSLVSALAGAGAMKATAPSATAVLDGINVGPDGSFGLRVHGTIGGASYAHTLNFDAQGGSPLIDSQPSDDAQALGAPLASCISTARTSLSNIASDLAAWTPTTIPPSTVDAGQ